MVKSLQRSRAQAAGRVVRAALLCALALVTGQGLAHGPSSGLSHDAGAGQPSPAGSGTPSAGEPPAGTATSGATRPRRARPQLASGAAFDAQGRLWMVGLDHQMRLVLRVAPADQPPGLGPERRLEQVRESVAAEGESRPKIAFGPRGQAVIAWTTPLPRPYTGNIRMIRSEDGGARFGEPFTVHQDRQVITHRFESIAFDASGALHVLWIDKRDVEAMRVARPQGASKGGAHTDYRGAAVYRVVSVDGGRSFSPDTRLFDHSCECCRIALAPTPEGGLAALWRHVFDPNERDHAFTRLTPGAMAAQTAQGATRPPSAPVRASFDRWALDACPHHGPGLAPAGADPDPSVGWHAVWFGDRAGRAAVRYGRLAHDGSPISVPVALPDEAAEHAAIAASGATVVIVWRSFDGRLTRLNAWVSQDSGRSFVQRTLAQSEAETDHPMLPMRGGEIYAFWRTAEAVYVERVTP